MERLAAFVSNAANFGRWARDLVVLGITTPLDEPLHTCSAGGEGALSAEHGETWYLDARENELFGSRTPGIDHDH